MNILLRLILFICLVFAGQCYATTAISYGYVANTVQSGAENLNNNGLINPSSCCRKLSSRDSKDRAQAKAFFAFAADFYVPKGETPNITRPLDSPHYSNAYEVELPSTAYPGVSRQRHNQLANQSLHEAFEADSAFAAKMEAQYPGIVDGVKPGARGAYSRSAPTKDVTWHHSPETGKLELLPIDHHTSSGPVQSTLHPDGKGGYSDWGTE